MSSMLNLPHTTNLHISGSVLNNVRGNQINDSQARSKPDLYHVLAPVVDAAYTRNGSVSRCFEGTRKNVIAAIMRCVNKGDRPISWLSGPAGSGKSAILQAIAERYADDGRLCASFFFSRGEGERSSIARLISTMAYQLSLSIPGTKPFLQAVIEHEPTITRRSLKYQFKKLIIETVLSSRGNVVRRIFTKPAVIVIDALDECDDKNLMVEFIEVVIKAFGKNRQLPLRLVTSSRVEEHIRQKLATPTAISVTHRLSLQDFDARLDIREFFRSSFVIIYQENDRVMRRVPLPWPSESELDTLVDKCDGLFIFANTLIKLIGEGKGLPQDKLQRALTLESGLDILYTQVLSDAPHDPNFERVIGTITLLRTPLPINSLEGLLRLPAEYIIQALLGTQSILMIPESDDKPIRFFHASLRDFLVTENRSGRFFVSPSRHLSLAIDCIACLTEPPAEGIFYDGVKLYACANWLKHCYLGLTEGGIDHFDSSISDSLIGYLTDFMSQSFDFWVNTILLEGDEEPLNNIGLVPSVLTELPPYPRKLVRRLHDVQQRAKV